MHSIRLIPSRAFVFLFLQFLSFFLYWAVKSIAFNLSQSLNELILEKKNVKHSIDWIRRERKIRKMHTKWIWMDRIVDRYAMNSMNAK